MQNDSMTIKEVDQKEKKLIVSVTKKHLRKTVNGIPKNLKIFLGWIFIIEDLVSFCKRICREKYDENMHVEISGSLTKSIVKQFWFTTLLKRSVRLAISGPRLSGQFGTKIKRTIFK